MRASPRLLLVGCWWLVISGGLLATGARAEQITTTPLQFYGLGTLTCAAWSPDGTRIVTGGSAGAFLRDVATSRVVRMFIGHAGAVTSVVFSPDSGQVLTGSLDGTAKLWNTSNGMFFRTFSGRTARYLPVTIIDDQEDEPDETVIVTLTSATSATLGATRAATLTIRGNDLPTAILRWPLYR